MRRAEPVDPVAARELAALDAALAGTAGADPELVALARDVRAAAPAMDPAARAALDERVANGFARPDPRRSRWRVSPRVLAPALGAVAAALVAVVVVLGGAQRGGDAGGGASGTSGVEAAPPAARDADSSAGGAAPDRAAPAGTPPPAAAAPVAPAARGAPSAAPPPPIATTHGRRVERTVRLALGARADRFDTVTDGVVRTTQRAGGFVAGSQIGREGERGTATFVLRIPAARLDAAVGALSRLAHVRSIEQATQDLTGAHDGTAARLRDAQTRRRALVAALATASGERAARLRARLERATARVRSLDRALRALRARTSYATVDLTVTARRPDAAASRGDDRWTPADAWRDARRGLEVAAGIAIIVAALALPLALVAAPAALALGALRRRRREAALDAA
jgi:hypothetical protein